MTGLFDFANGLTPRARPEDVLFPNLDLTVHYLREPVGEWLGYDTTVTYSAVGTGLTHTVLHDDDGPFAVAVAGAHGASRQRLTSAVPKWQCGAQLTSKRSSASAAAREWELKPCKLQWELI